MNGCSEEILPEVDPCLDNPDCNFETITYEQSFEDFPNPERGFYRYSETRASNYNTLSISQMKSWRSLKA